MPDPLRQDVANVARLLVVKVGTRVLTGADGLLDHDRIEALGRQFDTLLASGRSIVLVSSRPMFALLAAVSIAVGPT
jgi:glutamate 5-kinase